MQDKKYYSISEVTNLLNIPSHQLRYLEKRLPYFVIHKINNRRYYTSQDIKYLKTHIAPKILKLEQPIIPKLSDDQINKINCLIKNFQDLAIFIRQIVTH